QEATHEPGTRVETTQDFAQAESVESELTAAIANTEQTAADAPLTTAPVDTPQSEAQDPLTGKGYGGQSQEPGNGSHTEGLAADLDTESTPEVVSATPPVEQSQPSGVPASEIDGNDPLTEWDGQESDSSGAIREGSDSPEGQTGNIGPQRIGSGKLPEELLTPQAGPGMKGPGGGSGKIPGTPPKSGGGPPVGQYGSGTKGKGTNKYWGTVDGEGYHGSSNESCEKTVVGVGELWATSKTGNMIVDCANGKQYQVVWGKGYFEVTRRALTMEGDTPMPYTGGGNWGGEDPDPKEPVGGPDSESGHFVRMYGPSGGSDGSSGATPGDKDGDDDSGKFLTDGELSGGDSGGMVDPGGLDYNQANLANDIVQGAVKR
ncbi:MAG: hypothetical protein ISR60_02475, partial [Anaerolineales bacterium]|nr:hypothetical protein [Anaerolineales bacterium]